MSDPLEIQFEEDLEPFDTQGLAEKTLALMAAAQITRPVNLLFCSPQSIAEMNGQYRGQPKATDILSFGYDDPQEPLGDLALCLEVAQAQAQEFGLELEEELLRLLAHGLVHLLGYDHQSEVEEAAMLAMERRLLAAIGLEGLYP
ncbi:MAG: rRNA maturation RNase YbeY [bacterium]|nr:rRNA maturation RNase YbeY [bacterium]